jgi:hypothetical protein
MISTPVYIDMNEEEITRLDKGDTFITLIRPAEGNIAPYGTNGDVLWARPGYGAKSKYRLRIISALKRDDNWLIVMHRVMRH